VATPTVTAVEIVTDLTPWQVTLRSGAVVQLWADSYSEEDGHHTFGVLANVPPNARDGLQIAGETPSDPLRVVVALAQFASEDVVAVRSLG
jgi:hypothetical protein